MGRRSDRRSDDNLRTVLAQEAARIIRNQGIDDYRTAKKKAAANLGLRRSGALPNNREIELALTEYNRIFGGQRQQRLLDTLREAALEIMYELELFQPCLVGPVLSGNVTEHSVISLHLFNDASEEVAMQLFDRGVRHRPLLRKHRLHRDRVEEFPGYRFLSREFEVETTVFPERTKAHSPLSPVDGKPMRRAKVRTVEQLTRMD
jgi:hypothetical protein